MMIPNSMRVTHFPAIGHVNERGAGAVNSFGADFKVCCLSSQPFTRNIYDCIKKYGFFRFCSFPPFASAVISLGCVGRVTEMCVCVGGGLVYPTECVAIKKLSSVVQHIF